MDLARRRPPLLAAAAALSAHVLLKLLSAVVLTVAATQVAAQQADPRANDGVQVFSTFCVKTLGNRDRALAALGDGNAMAKRLSDDLVKKAQLGREGGVGWTIRSPRDAILVLDYEARGICGVRIIDADQGSVQAAFEAFVTGAAHQAGATLSSSPVAMRKQDGVVITYQTFSYPIGDRTAFLALTTADKRVSLPQQHFMTFGFVKPEL